jgi:hypothetical protein
VAAPKFPQPAKSTPSLTPDPSVTDENDEVEGIDVEAEVTHLDRNELGGKPSEQAEEDVKELFKGSTVNHEVERKKNDDIVSAFPDDFRLLPHQVQAREWMKNRETGRSHGGILADDMGLVLLAFVTLRI